MFWINGIPVIFLYYLKKKKNVYAIFNNVMKVFVLYLLSFNCNENLT